MASAGRRPGFPAPAVPAVKEDVTLLLSDLLLQRLSCHSLRCPGGRES